MSKDRKELELLGCKTFVCPNISLIDEKCSDTDIRKDIIERAREIAIDYFKKTYHNPRYSHAKFVLPATVYIACRLKGKKRTQEDIGNMFGVSHMIVKKWYKDIMGELNIELNVDRNIGVPRFEYNKFDVNDELGEIEKIGNIMQVKENTIDIAKELATVFFEKEKFIRFCKSLRNLRPAFVYTASIIGNDLVTQLEISHKVGIPESNIAKWHNKVIDALGIKIIAHNGHVVSAIDGNGKRWK